jgi:ER membrane protein complex subunit 2
MMLYPQAVFCLEEILLHMPGDINTMLLLADTLYSIGGHPNWRTARTYYSGVLELTEGKNVRALYGVCLCGSALQTKAGRGASGVAAADDDAGLPALAAEALVQRYAVECPDKLALVKGM